MNIINHQAPGTRHEIPIILSIETSCDETGVAITKAGKIISNLVASQVKEHEPYGGVVPELASRKHVSAINYLIDKALAESKIGFKDIDAVAATVGPGLVGALMVGVSAAKTLSLGLGVSLIAVNHIEAHIFALKADNPGLKPPFICLVVSGGHTMLVMVEEFGKYKLLGQTVDDAAGEAFDKIAKFLGLPYPGGPQIEAVAKKGNEDMYALPRPLKSSGDFKFSFSGLKTAVIYLVRKLDARGEKYKKEDLAASFQEAVVDVLSAKTFAACKEFDINKVAIVGGVAANTHLRAHFQKMADKLGLGLFLPNPNLATDNAAMVGLAANHYFEQGKFVGLDETVDPNLSLPAIS